MTNPTLKFDIPLLVRLFEYCKETAKSDIVLHKMVERAWKISDDGKKDLTMDDYTYIISGRKK